MTAPAVEQALGAHTVIARPLVYRGSAAGFEYVDLAGRPVTADEQRWANAVADVTDPWAIVDALNAARVEELLGAA